MAQLDAEFAKTKDALLLAAAAKKARQEQEEGAKRELAAEAKHEAKALQQSCIHESRIHLPPHYQLRA